MASFDLPPDAVVGIVAGGGTVPDALRAYLEGHGRTVRTIALAGEASATADATHPIGDVEGILRSLRSFGVTHAVLVGWVRRRPRLRDGRVGWRTARLLPPLVRNLARGDDAMLRAAIAAVESTGVRVVGVHELWPELVAGEGPAGRHAPSAADEGLIAHGAAIARALGAHDAGQGVVMVGRRAVALEGVEGTDRMLARVAELRREGAVRQGDGVLVKVAKPGQELRTDLPSIGPGTVRAAAEAGLNGIAVEAGRSLLIERERTVSLADERGLFVWGFRP